MLKYITLPTKGSYSAYDILKTNGFERRETDKETHDKETHEHLISLGVMSSYTHWYKDNKVYMFSGWEEDEQTGRMADKPRFITALDITDMVKEL